MSSIRIQKRSDHDTTNTAISNPHVNENNINLQAQASSDTGQNLAQEISSAGSGQSLDAGAREFLEPKFGHSFENIKIHADGHADQLSKSVNAKAFTTGQDVFFREGAYQPNTTEGKHLLAHELTHTIQQSRGVVSGNTLGGGVTVSDPNDAFEQEARDTAKNIFSDEPSHDATSASRGNSLSPIANTQSGQTISIMRDEASDLAAGATQGQATYQAEQKAQPSLVGQVSNVRDATQAKKILNDLNSWDGQMEEGRSKGEGTLDVAGGITSSHIQANEHAKNELSNYLVSTGEQARTLSSFQLNFNSASSDYARIQGMVAQYEAIRGTQVNPGNQDSTGGSQAAKQIIDETKRSGNADTAKDVLALAASNPSFATQYENLKNLHTQIEETSATASSEQMNSVKATSDVVKSISGLEAGAIPRGDTSPEATSALAGVRKECQAVKDWVGKALGAAEGKEKELLGSAGAALGLPGAAAGKAVDLAAKGVQKGVDFAIDLAYEGKINELENKINLAKQHSKDNADFESLAGVRSSLAAWKAAIQNMLKAVQKLMNLKNQIQTTITAMQNSATNKKGGGGSENSDIATLLGFLGESEKFVAQVDAAIGMGEAEMQAASYAKADKAKMTTDGKKEGLPYYEPYKTYHINGGWRFEAMKREVHIYSYSDSTGGAEGDKGINSTVEKSITTLKSYKDLVVGFRRELGTALGMGDLGSGRASGGPAPSVANAKNPQ